MSEQTPQQPATTAAPARHGWLYRVTVVLVVVALSTSLASSLLNLFGEKIADSYAVYRADVERSYLEEANRRMKAELIALRTRNSKLMGSDGEIHQKLDNLASMVEGATGLGFFKRGRDTQGQVLARREQPKESQRGNGALAALLDDPQLNKGSSKKGSGRSRAAVGGSEVPCKDHLCEFGVSKEDVALRPSASAPRETSQSESDALLQRRLDYATEVMRILPIGSPVDGEISSGFGYRRSPFSRRASFHEGVDLSLRHGGRVLVTGAGVVDRVAYNSTYGLMVDIEHAPGLKTRYAHLTKSLVRPGQKVTRGDIIALSGSTGRSTGPHLHYEVIFKNRPKNPRPFIELADELRNFTW